MRNFQDSRKITTSSEHSRIARFKFEDYHSEKNKEDNRRNKRDGNLLCSMWKQSRRN